MATPDNELPVWPFLPNWSDGILERLSWATVILPSETGAEQRYSSRLSPRREFEVLFNPFGDTRTFFDLFISQLGGQEMMIPMWHDRHKLASPISIGDDRVDCDTIYGEFMDGGMAIVIGRDAWGHKVLEIDTVDDDGFTLAVDADFDWPEGALILALRRSRIDLQPALMNLTSSVGDSTIRFLLNQANDLPGYGAWDGLEYGGYPVMTMETDWKDGIEIGFSRITETEDNGTGLAFIRDIADRAFRTKPHTWHLVGKQANWEFRQFLYRLGGRRSPIWMPTGNQDMAVAITANAGQGNAQVRKVGLTYVGGPKPGRDRVLARTGEGYQVRRITGLGAPANASVERINFDSNLAYALPAGSLLQFLEIMRADGDDIEIKHHTDTDGASECSINFVSFSNTRVAATPISVPTPTGLISSALCNMPGAGEDLCTSYNPWSLRLAMDFTADPPLPGHGFGLYTFPLYQAVVAGMMPNDGTLVKGYPVQMGFGTTRFVPQLGFNLEGYWDNNYPNGDPGGPICGWRVVESAGYLIRYEHYAFFPLSTDPDDRHVHWDTQIQRDGYATGGQVHPAAIQIDYGDVSSITNIPILQQRLFPLSWFFDF